MPKRDVERQIEQISQHLAAPVTDATLSALRKALHDRVNLVVAKAAQVVAELRLKPLIPELLAAFDRLFADPCSSDPQCWGKNAIAKALTDLDYDESAPFLHGCRHVQLEPVYGGKADSAVKLRSLCNLALVQCADLPRAVKLRHLVTGMADVEDTVRIDAIRALEQMEGEEAALLIRLKAAAGDKRAAVIGQALESLLRLEGTNALEFVRPFLDGKERDNPREFSSSSEEFLEEAALALGASRLPAAVGTLVEEWERYRNPVFLHAISASRQETALAFLQRVIREGRFREAESAIDALALHRDSAEVRSSVQAAVESRDSPELRQRFRAKFGNSPCS